MSERLVLPCLAAALFFASLVSSAAPAAAALCCARHSPITDSSHHHRHASHRRAHAGSEPSDRRRRRTGGTTRNRTRATAAITAAGEQPDERTAAAASASVCAVGCSARRSFSHPLFGDVSHAVVAPAAAPCHQRRCSADWPAVVRSIGAEGIRRVDSVQACAPHRRHEERNRGAKEAR